MQNPIDHRKRIKKLGVNVVAEASGLNKSTISRYVNGEREWSLANFVRVERALLNLDKQSLVGRTSVFEATDRVVRGENWQIAYFDFVDSLIATESELLIFDRPADGLEIRLLALISSMVMQLCDTYRIQMPEWAKLSLPLEEPWFVTRFASLHPMLLVESPVYFKRNNIFVGDDFLKRV